MDIKILKKYIDEDIISYAMNFNIPETYLADDPELINLILKSKALETDKDKQNWFSLLPLMTVEQINKLKEILQKEKDKLEEIEKKYAEKKSQIRQKYLLRWKKLGYVERIKEIKAKEENMKSQDEAEAEDLLNDL